MQYHTTDDVKKLGTILGIWAHPDDESFFSAGIMSIAAENGQDVVCVTATKGEAGVRDVTKWPVEKLADIRAREMEEAMEILGVFWHHWLPYYDGHCSDIDTDAALEVLRPLMQRYSPDTIITFPPNGVTGHDDHRAVSQWSRALREKYKIKNLFYVADTAEAHESHLKELDRKHNIYFNLPEPVLIPLSECDYRFKLPKETAAKKVAALRAMPSQTEGLLSELSDDELCLLLCTEVLISADRTDISWSVAK